MWAKMWTYLRPSRCGLSSPVMLPQPEAHACLGPAHSCGGVGGGGGRGPAGRLGSRWG